MEALEIKVKLLEGGWLPQTISVGDWIDLAVARDTVVRQNEVKYIPLGVAMQLPEGYEALMAPRSSTCKRWGLLQANSIGVIDESYCGDGDEWMFPVYGTRYVDIPAGTRLCQFRLIKHQPHLIFKEVETLGNQNRGGRGSTGV